MVSEGTRSIRPRKPQEFSRLTDKEWQDLVRALTPANRKWLVDRIKRAEELEVRVGKNSQNSSKPPSTDLPAQKDKRNQDRRKKGKKRKGRKRKPGGQKGHPGHQRPLVPSDQVDESFDHFPKECRGCYASLVGVQPDPNPLRHQTAEVPEIKPKVTEHRLHRSTCPCCNTTTTASLPEGISTSCFGPCLRALILLLVGRFRISRREMVAFCDEVLGLSISLGSIANILSRSCRALDSPFKEVEQATKKASEANMDETGWREKGVQRYLWVLLTSYCVLFCIGRRTKEMAQAMLGENFAGRLITDRYKAYFWIKNKFHQICWAHLARDFEDLVARGGKAKEIGKKLLRVKKDLFKIWHAYKDGRIGWKSMQSQMDLVEKRMIRLLEKHKSSRSPARKLCNSLYEIRECLFVFSKFKNLEPTNNSGERTIRPAVQWRKICFGTQSKEGSRFVERILTVVMTCRVQKRPLLPYLEEILEAEDAGREIPSIFSEVSEASQPANRAG